METPLVVAYSANPLSFLLARRLVSVESIGMVNLLAGRRIAPEFVQRLPVRRIADELLSILDDYLAAFAHSPLSERALGRRG